MTAAAAVADLPTAITRAQLENRAMQVARLLEEGSVSRTTIDAVMSLLIPRPGRARGFGQGDKWALEELPSCAATLVGRRLDEAEEFVHFDLASWERLAQIVLPEMYDPVPPPLEPTDTWPGSSERIAVYAERAARGEGLHHEGDVIDPPDHLALLFPVAVGGRPGSRTSNGQPLVPRRVVGQGPEREAVGTLGKTPPRPGKLTRCAHAANSASAEFAPCEGE